MGYLSQGQGLAWKDGGSLETKSWEQVQARCAEDRWTPVELSSEVGWASVA